MRASIQGRMNSEEDSPSSRLGFTPGWRKCSWSTLDKREVGWLAQVRTGPPSLGEQETAFWETGKPSDWMCTGAQRMPLFGGGLVHPVPMSGLQNPCQDCTWAEESGHR